MIDDLISRQAAIDAIANCTNCGDEKTLRAYVAKHSLDNGWTGGVLQALDAVKELPSAQPEIIHCTDCRHHGMAICRIWSRYGTINTPGYGFCYRAERKEQDE